MADEKLILLKSILSLLNFWAYMRTDDVLAVPLPPTRSTALLQMAVLGYIMMKFMSNSALIESMVGISSWEN